MPSLDATVQGIDEWMLENGFYNIGTHQSEAQRAAFLKMLTERLEDYEPDTHTIEHISMPAMCVLCMERGTREHILSEKHQKLERQLDHEVGKANLKSERDGMDYTITKVQVVNERVYLDMKWRPK